MTKWAAITIALYMAILLVATYPLTLSVTIRADTWPEGFRDAAEVYTVWPYWVVLGILVAAQALMLVVPVKARANITMKKRHIITVLGTAGFLMGVLTLALVMSLVCAFLGDEWDEWIGWAAIAVAVVSWAFWIGVFRRFARGGAAPADWMQRITARLYKASILELLVAVGSHIVVRRRGDCSAPIMTAWGMGMGIAVMLISFGPGVFYLFAERRERMLSRRQRQSAP